MSKSAMSESLDSKVAKASTMVYDNNDNVSYGNDVNSDIDKVSTDKVSSTSKNTKTNSKKKNRYEPKVWKQWYERAMHMSLAGFSNIDIAKKVDKTPESVCRIMKSNMYQKRLRKLLDKADEASIKKALTTQQRLENEKEKLFELALQMIYGYECDNEGVRASLLKWMLEKFPEFLSQKEKMIVGIRNETNVTMQVTEQQLQRQREVAEDLRGVRKLLNKGNPFVIEKTPLDDNLLPIEDNRDDKDDK